MTMKQKWKFTAWLRQSDKCSGSEAGFSLFELIAALVLVGLFIHGLLWGWYFVDSRRQSTEDYWESKAELELAYEITHRQIREHAAGNVIILENGIRFTDDNGAIWSFVRNGANYLRVVNDQTDILCSECLAARFTLTESVVTIELERALPAGWEGDGTDLRIVGKVFLRNLK